jgi:hypothetical protein
MDALTKIIKQLVDGMGKINDFDTFDYRRSVYYFFELGLTVKAIKCLF